MSMILGETQNERSKAAAWAWYQRGASGSSAEPSSAFLALKRRRRTSSFSYEDGAAPVGIRPLPSRFKREAAAAHFDQHPHASPPASPAESSDHVFAAPAALASPLKHDLQSDPHPSIGELSPCSCSPRQSTAATCRICHPSRDLHQLPPADPDHCTAGSSDGMPVERRRKSASSPPAYCSTHWSEKLFGVPSSRKSFSSSGVSSSGKACSPDHEHLDAIMSQFAGGDSPGRGVIGAAAAAALYLPDSRSSLLDSFELCAVLKKMGYRIKPREVERALNALEMETETETQVAGNSYQSFPSPPANYKQSLYDLLGWSERGLDMKGSKSCSTDCVEEEGRSSDLCYHAESPEINISSCSTSSNYDTKAAAHLRQQRHWRLCVLFSQSLSNALHHMHLPIASSFSNAFHHLPHSFSHTLHHLPHLPHSFSNALAHFSHSLSSAYHSLHIGSHRHHAEEAIAAPRLPINTTQPHTPKSRNTAVPTLIAAKHHPQSSPPFNNLQGLSKSDDYMLIYSSVKKHSDYGVMSGHHHYHHHHHHYHYIF